MRTREPAPFSGAVTKPGPTLLLSVACRPPPATASRELASKAPSLPSPSTVRMRLPSRDQPAATGEESVARTSRAARLLATVVRNSLEWSSSGTRQT